MPAETSNSEGNSKKIGGNITFVDFKLEPAELVVVRKITGNYVKKISEVSNYKELKLRLKKREHGKAFLYEIEAEAVITHGKKTAEKTYKGKNVMLNATVADYNLFSALSAVLEKIFNEASHKSRTTREIGEEMKKSQI